MILLLAFVIGNNTPTHNEIEQQAIQARASITTAYFRLKRIEERSDTSSVQTTAITIWIDGNKLRGESIRDFGPSRGQRSLSCLNCEKIGYGADWNDVPRASISFRPLAKDGVVGPMATEAIDPRRLGYSFNSLGTFRPSQGRLDSVVGSSNRNDPVLSSVEVNKSKLWLIEWKRKNDAASISVWIDPSKGNNVVKMQVTTKEQTTIVESVLQLVQPRNIWFPRTVTLEKFTDNKVTYRERVEIEEIKLNDSIDPDVFRVTGLNLPEGTYVQMPDTTQSGFWRDGSIQPETTTTRFQDTTPPVPVNPPAKVDYWLVAVCGIFVVAAIAVIVFRKKQATS